MRSKENGVQLSLAGLVDDHVHHESEPVRDSTAQKAEDRNKRKHQQFLLRKSANPELYRERAKLYDKRRAARRAAENAPRKAERLQGLLARPSYVPLDKVYREAIRRVNWDRRDGSYLWTQLPAHWFWCMWCNEKSVLTLWAILIVSNQLAWDGAKRAARASLKPGIKERRRLDNEKRKEARGEYYRNRREDPIYVEACRQKAKQDFQKRKQVIYEYRKKRRKTDPQYQLASNIRTYIYQRVGGKMQAKGSRFRELTGCTAAELRLHLERQFLPGMGWHNYGRGHGKWNVDHIQPCASFDLTNPKQAKQCFSWKNMRPLWWDQNIRKSDEFVLHGGFSIL